MTELEQEILDILKEVAIASNIQNYELKPDIEVQVGDGFLSTFYKGDILDKDTGKSFRVAIKKRPKFEFDYDNFFSNEIIFYTKSLPALLRKQQEANLPEPFDNTAKFYASNMDTSNQFLALEHLQPAGYVMHEKKEHLSQDQLKMIFKAYGKFHALSFVLKKQNFEEYNEVTKGLKDNLSFFTNRESARIALTNTIKEVLNNLHESSQVQEEGKALFKNVIPTIEKSFRYEGSYRCLTHGDCWSNNMLFKYSVSGKLEHFKLVDFQLSRESTPVHDLSYFFYAGAAIDDLDNLENYLKIYHESFSKVVRMLGEDPEELFPYNVLIQEWKDNALMGIILAVYLWQLKLINKEEYEDMLNDGSDNDNNSLKETLKSVVNLMNSVLKTERYQSLSRAIFTHAYDFGILTRDKAA